MNRPKVQEFKKPQHISDYPVGPCFDSGFLVTKNAGWRTLRPVINKEACVGCNNCYMCCPDGVIFKYDGKVDIDYDFCKGCGVCAKECRLKAITMEREV